MVRATRALLQAAAEAVKSSRTKRLPKGSKSRIEPDGVKIPRLRVPRRKSVTEADVANSETAANVVNLPKLEGRVQGPSRPKARPKSTTAEPKARPSSQKPRLWLPSDDLETKHRLVFPADHKRPPSSSEVRDNLAVRADVASEQLCDDILNYLAPTLEPYKGCTIIDVNPGACLWSSKLHDFLKPKRHILMEPEVEYVEPFIQPLLELPGSTYRHTTMHGAHPKGYWPNYAKLLTDGELMPRRQTLASDDPRGLKIDHSLLVTGNLTRRFTSRSRHANKTVRFGELILQHMAWAGLARDLFHNGGPVRMLWWCSELTRSNVIAKNMSATVTFNASMSVCASITPVVECPQEVSAIRSPGTLLSRQETPSMVEERSRRLRASMEKLGMVVPENRAAVWPKANALDGRPGFKTPYTFDCQSIEKLTAALASTEHRWQQLRAAGPLKPRSREEEHKRMVAELQYPQLEGIVQAAAKVTSTQNYYRFPNGRRRCMIFADIFLAVIHLEVNYKQLEEAMTAKLEKTASDGSASLPDDLQALRERILSLGNAIDANSTEIYPLYVQITEDQLAMFADPPRGGPNKRAYPSLCASSEDFLPAKAMSLLDMVPRTVDYTVPGIAGRGEVCASTQEILKSLFAQRGNPLLATLEQLAPNASKDLLPLMPSLQDPRKGGRLNPHHVSIRQITDEMIDELMRAWFEWPFRLPHGAMAGGSRGEGEVRGLFDKGHDIMEPPGGGDEM